MHLQINPIDDETNSRFLTGCGWGRQWALFYALTLKTITQNKFTCSIIFRNGPSKGSILFSIMMLKEHDAFDLATLLF